MYQTNPLPLQFDFAETEGKGYQLKIKGLNQMIVLDSYRSVLSEGKIIQLENRGQSNVFQT